MQSYVMLINKILGGIKMMVNEKDFKIWMEKKYKRDFTLLRNEYDWLQAYERILRNAYPDDIAMANEDYSESSGMVDRPGWMASCEPRL